MTNSDTRMDRELRGQALLSPPRSVWPEVEAQLDRLERRARRSGRVKVVVPAVAASMAAAIMLYIAVAPSLTDVSAMQKTVDTAVRNAMPAAAFSALQVNSRNLVLDTLLVSARPREAVKAMRLGAPLARDNGSGARQTPPQQQKTVDEF